MLQNSNPTLHQRAFKKKTNRYTVGGDNTPEPNFEELTSLDREICMTGLVKEVERLPEFVDLEMRALALDC